MHRVGGDVNIFEAGEHGGGDPLPEPATDLAGIVALALVAFTAIGTLMVWFA